MAGAQEEEVKFADMKDRGKGGLLPITYDVATRSEAKILAELNSQLIRDEGHDNPMSLDELEARMSSWLKGEYQAVLFKAGKEYVAYALFNDREGEIHLRQFFVVRHKRRKGVGRRAMEILLTKIWPKGKSVRVEVLVGNRPGIAFWHSIGFADYSMTMRKVPMSDKGGDLAGPGSTGKGK